MRFQVILMGSAVVVAIVVLFSSRFARAVLKEAILHPHHHCVIQVDRDKVSVKRTNRAGKLEG